MEGGGLWAGFGLDWAGLGVGAKPVNSGGWAIWCWVGGVKGLFLFHSFRHVFPSLLTTGNNLLRNVQPGLGVR